VRKLLISKSVIILARDTSTGKMFGKSSMKPFSTWPIDLNSLPFASSSFFNILCDMPLDKVGKEYAAMLYQKRLGAILANQKQELDKVVEDFGRRNMMQSGMYLSARAKVMGKRVGLMAEAMAQTLSQAYEKAGLPLNQTTLQEITVEVNQFCEAQKAHLRMAAHNLVSQQFPGSSQSKPQGLVEALAGEMESALSGFAANAMRDLTIKHPRAVCNEYADRASRQRQNGHQQNAQFGQM